MRTELDALWSLQKFMAGILLEPWDVRVDLEAGDPPERPFALIELAGPGETSGAPVTQDIALPATVNLYLPAQPSRWDADQAALELREQVWQAIKWGQGAEDWAPTTDRIPLYAYDPRVECHRFAIPAGTTGPATFTVGPASTGPLDLPLTAADLAVAITGALRAAGVRVEAGDVVGQDRGAQLWDVYYQGSLAGIRPGLPAVDVGVGRVMLEGAPAPWRGPSDYMRVESFTQNTVRDQADPTLVMVAVDLRLTFARGLPLPLGRRILQRVYATVGSGPGGRGT